MRLTIEVIETQDSVLALVCNGDEPIIGKRGSDPRQATQLALTAYWIHQDAKVQAAKLAEQEQSAVISGPMDDFEGTFTFTAPVVTFGTTPVWETAPSRITALIEGAVTSDTSVEIVYTDAKENETTRVVRPSSVGEWAMVGFCELADDVRMFRLDRIAKARRV